MGSYYDSTGFCEVCNIPGEFDQDLVQCENDHWFCHEHMLDLEEKEGILQILGNTVDPRYIDDEDYGRVVSKKYCPLCQMQSVSDYMLLSYCASLLSPDGGIYTLKQKLIDKFKGDNGSDRLYEEIKANCEKKTKF